MPYLVSLCLFSLVFSSVGEAAYRAYRLSVSHLDKRGRVVRSEPVVTTLDPNQYVLFHGLPGKVKVKVQQTWYCPGDTSRREICPPMTKPTRGLASETLGDPGRKTRLPFELLPIIP